MLAVCRAGLRGWRGRVFVVMPLYVEATYQQVAALVFPALLPFNVLKALANSVLAIVSYRKLAALLGESDLGSSSSH